MASKMAATGNTVNPPLVLLAQHPGWCVFPIMCGEKKPPLLDDNLRLASNDPATIKQWAIEHPSCNWGLSCAKSHLIVVDVDTKPGKAGRDTLERLELEWGPLPPTLTARSPSGGLHFYYSETNVVRHRMKANAFGRDVDSTNYVLLPDSILRARPAENQFPGRYKFTNRLPVAPAPDWFALYLDTSSNNSAAGVQQVPEVEQDTPDLIKWAKHYLEHDAPPARQGDHGEFTLLMVAAVLKDHGISEQMAVELLGEFYNSRCEPAWDIGDGATADRLDVKVHNAWQYLRQTTPGAHTAAADFGNAGGYEAAALDATAAWWKDFDKRNTKKVRNARAKVKADAKLRAKGRAFVQALKKVTR